jgi:hypothetical protein
MKTTFKREAIIGNQGFVINGGKTGGGSGYSVSSPSPLTSPAEEAE